MSHLLFAADELDRMAKEHEAWWMAKSRVSIAMQIEYDSTQDRYKWAAQELRDRANKQKP